MKRQNDQFDKINPNIGRPPNPDSRKGRMVLELHERKSRYVLEASRQGMGLKAWVCKILDAEVNLNKSLREKG